MIKAVLFDMDGLIIDSEPLHSLAYEQVIKSYGKTPILNEKDIVHPVGIKEKEIWPILQDQYNIDEDVQVLMDKRSKIYLDLLHKSIQPTKGLIDLIKLLKTHKIKMAVASSSVMEHIKAVLTGLGIIENMDAIVSGQFINRGKPHPDIFLEAAKQLQVNPKDCLVLEDAESGVLAGKSAGAKVIAVLNKFTSDHDVSSADLQVTSLKEITWKKITSLWE